MPDESAPERQWTFSRVIPIAIAFLIVDAIIIALAFLYQAKQKKTSYPLPQNKNLETTHLSPSASSSKTLPSTLSYSGIPFGLTKTVYLQSWDGNEKHQLELPNRKSIAFDPDKNRLLTLSFSGNFLLFSDIGTNSVAVVDLKSGKRETIPQVDGAFYLRSPYADVIVYQSNNSLVEKNLLTGQETTRMPISPSYKLVDISGGGKMVIVEENVDTFKAIDLQTQQELSTLFKNAPVFIDRQTGYKIVESKILKFTLNDPSPEQTIVTLPGPIDLLSLSPKGNVLAASVKTKENEYHFYRLTLSNQEIKDYGKMFFLSGVPIQEPIILSQNFYNDEWVQVASLDSTANLTQVKHKEDLQDWQKLLLIEGKPLYRVTYIDTVGSGLFTLKQ